MATLIYKRTHTGDPDHIGWFGIGDCMGRVRNMEFDAVVGIGGMGREARAAAIAGKLNWVGIGATKVPSNGRGPLVHFAHFILFDANGPELWKLAPKLASRFYATHGPRFKIDEDLSNEERVEVARILRRAKGKPASISTPPVVMIKPKQRCRICCSTATII